jgi:hypothetical protein
MKLSEAIENVSKLTTDAEDLKDALGERGNYSGTEPFEQFITKLQADKRLSIEVLISALISVEYELKSLLDAEIVIQEVPGE